MEKNKILLEKIEIKKIRKNLENKFDVTEKKLGETKPKLLTGYKVSKEQDLIDFGSVVNQDVVEIYPRNMAMAGDGNQQNDVDLSEKYELNIIVLEDGDKYDSDDSPFELNNPKSPHQSKMSSNSLSPQSPLIYLESENFDQSFTYDMSKSDNNARSKRMDPESEMLLLSVDSFQSCLNQSVDERQIPQKDMLSQLAYDKITIGKPCNGNIPTAQTNFSDENDIETDNSEDTFEMQESILSINEEEDQIKKLKDALETTTSCLVKCLENLQNTVQKQKGGDCTIKSDCTIPKCKYSEEDSNTLRRDNDNSDASISQTLRKNSPTGAKQMVYAERCLIQKDSPKSIYTEATKPKYFSCNCCYECLQRSFQSTGRNLNRDILEAESLSEKSTAIGDFPNNATASNITLKQSRLTNRRHRHPFSDLTISNKNETDSVMEEVKRDNSGLVLRSNTRSAPEMSSLIEEEKNGECRKEKKSKVVELSPDNDQFQEHEVEIQKNNEAESNTFMIFFLPLVFVMCVIFCFLLVIFFTI